jgi:hypothetical protein
MTTIGHTTNPADARRRHIRAMQLIFAGAATVATFALFSAAPQGEANAAAPSGPQYAQVAPGANGGSIIAVNDNDNNNPSSGDVFTQNAQDQSTANGAGTS